ncbi:ABC-transporter [Trichoderma reesei QM6a]|uniref:ABC-transporter n=2 Tax=Hypocrea jecorina TaxID=51453 RepID=G0RKW3_HYPJQ|nr:ABC-transporter [Trichoderma reesei QM6a]EGR48468.1 ABC-transporter [Trichoderma reesei QM6a]ETS07160.1 P-loop containing nucleoside triphosphate hydrolase protein [Trichoderma reesei RUT C-30]
MAEKDKETASSPASTQDSTLITDTGPSAGYQATKPESKPQRSSFKHLFSFTKWNHTAPLLAALVASAAIASIKSLLSVVLGKTFDAVSDFGVGHGSGSETLDNVAHWALILLGMGIADWVASTALLLLWIIFGELQANSARKVIFESLLSKKMSWFDSLDQGISSLLVRIQTQDSQTRELQLAASQVLGLLVTDLIVSVASLAIAFSSSWKLTLVLIATLPVSLVIMSIATRRLDPAIQSQKLHQETASKLATSSIKAIEIVKIFNGGDHELRQYYEAIKLASKQYLIQAKCNCFQMGYVAFWVIGMFVAAFWYGTVLVEQGLSPGHVITTFFATLTAFQGIEALLPQWLVLAKGMSAGLFLSSLSNQSDDKTGNTQSGRTRPAACVGNVDLVDVTFAYPSNPTKAVLNRSSMSFLPGQLTFIVGRSGSGKSTIGNLIAQFYDPSSGIVCLDGHPLTTLDEDWVRSNVTLIQQSSVMFDDSVFNNVAVGFGDPESVSKEAVSSACEFALLQSTISSLPQGLETRIGPSGIQLSGGQAQRLALARARIRDPTVLILDEVTSSLDQVNRGLVMDAIREWRRGKTTIIITHDVDQIEDEDFVYVMDNASLVQQGLRKELDSLSTGPFIMLSRLAPIEVRPPSPTQRERTASGLLGSTKRTTSTISETSHDKALSMSNPARNRFSQYKALGAGTAIALEMRKKQIWEGFDVGEEPREIARSGSFCEAEKRQSSNTVDEVYGSPRRCSCPEPDDLLYVFGKAERREGIPGLRLAATHVAPPVMDEGIITKNRRPKPSTLLKTLGTVWPILRASDRAIFVVGIVVCIIAAAATPIFSFCLSRLFGVLWLPDNRAAEAKKWALYLMATGIIDGTATGFGHYMLERTGQSWVNALRLEALKRILQQSKSWFDKESNSASRINECLDRDSEETRNIVGRFIPLFISAVGMITVSVIWALTVSWKLTLVALAPLPLIVGAVKGYTTLSEKWEARCNQGATDAGALLNETFVNIRVVRALKLEKYFSAKYQKSMAHVFGLGKRRAGYTCALFGLYESMSFPLTALVFYYATVLLTRNDGVTLTQMLQVINLLLFSIGMSAGALDGMPQLTMAQATATRLLGYVTMPIEPEEQGDRGTKLSNPLPISLRDVEFTYPQSPNSQVLRGVSFDITPGSCTAIVGSSGSGKSTIISLLTGLYRPSNHTASSLTYAGIPSSALNTHHLRSTMAYVSQTPRLFPTSILDNIAYGLPPASSLRKEANIHAAAKAANIHDFIVSLPQGYATPVGEGGIALSGGQAQRLSIARALVRQPRLLVLDEPTSALDAECSGMIRQTISELVGRARTKGQEEMMAIVMVTHTPEMMRICDNIVVIDGGVKVEEGTYEELMAARGAFRHLVSRGGWHGGEKS